MDEMAEKRGHAERRGLKGIKREEAGRRQRIKDPGIEGKEERAHMEDGRA